MGNSDTAKCDIVMPVYNGLTYVKDCIFSLREFTNSDDYHLFIIDDHSDSVTAGYLRDCATDRVHVTLHRNLSNMGFVKSCNLGISMGTAPFVTLLNSDVVLTPGWLERLMECAETEADIASVNPLTNYASQISLPMVAGGNFLGMDEVLRIHSPRNFPDVVTGVGFCMMLRRSALEEVGLLDEVFGKGYCEDSDLCMRLTARGYRTVVADNVYVYHRGRGAFTDRTERYRTNRIIFDERWTKEYKCQFRAFKKARPLGPVRGLFPSKKRWDPLPASWVAGREIIAGWRKKDAKGLLRTTARSVLNVLKNRRDLVTPKLVARITRQKKIRVTYVLHKLVIAGGVLSVIQLVNELILLGIEARIATLFEDPAIYDWTKLYTRPMVFRSSRELIAEFPETDIAVATLWKTVPRVAQLVRDKRARKSVYFIQDFEPWFFTENQKKRRTKVMETYGMIENRVVKSEWLCSMLNQNGFPAHKITLGMDLGCFYPREKKKNKTVPSVLAMARPRTPRRGFGQTVRALREIRGVTPELEIVLFGDRFLEFRGIPFSFRNEGVITDQERLARLYSEADVFVDGSQFQGFGRCGLEAMACGTACVLTSTGGVNEYARDGENCLLVPPDEPAALARAATALLNSTELRKRLVSAGLKTASAYSHKREARETLSYFRHLLGKEAAQCFHACR